MINNQAGLNDQFNQWLAVDETTGPPRRHLLRHGRRRDPQEDQRLLPDLDRRRRHLERRRPRSPPRRPTRRSAGADAGNQYGDYNSLSSYAGKFFPSWTDRRNNAKEEIWTAPITEP